MKGGDCEEEKGGVTYYSEVSISGICHNYIM